MELVSDPISSGIFKITTPNNFEPWKEKRIRAAELAELENNIHKHEDWVQLSVMAHISNSRIEVGDE